MTRSAPVPAEDVRLYSLGSIRGVLKASEFSGLSRHEIIALTDADIIAWFPHKDRGDRMISKRSLIEYLARAYGSYKGRAGDRA